MQQDTCSGDRHEHKQLFVVRYLAWKPDRVYPLGYVWKVVRPADSMQHSQELLKHIYQVPATIDEEKFGALLKRAQWVSLGGGIHFTGDDYPLDLFADRLKAFSETYGVQVYLEPGEASITRSTTLETTVLDTLFNGKNLAIVDASIEAHMLDLLIYRETAKVAPDDGPHRYMVCGKSCLAGDIFGEFSFPADLKTGDRISIQDAAGYTMVKKNWFNGVKMPAIAVRELDGSITTVREFSYEDYEKSLS